MDLFAPAEVEPFGSGPLPRQGYFFGFDLLSWAIYQPESTPIGYPTSRLVYHNSITWEIQENSHSTRPLGAEYTDGTRIEFGRVSGRNGWLFSTYHLNTQTQKFSDTDVDVVFRDLPDAMGAPHLEGVVADMVGYIGDVAQYANFTTVDLPISFDEMFVENRADTWGVELMYLRRAWEIHRGGFIELFAGVRYLEFDEKFQVDLRGIEVVNADDPPAAVDGVANFRFVYDQGPNNDPTATDWNPIGPGNVLADSRWITEAENHIVGPQIGGRWFAKRGRWCLSAEGRFLAGLNVQNISNRGILGSELNEPMPFNFPGPVPPDYPYVPYLREPYTFDNTAYIREWSPAGEVRLELIGQLTHGVSIKAGWNGMWLGGIARASAMPDYTISDQSVMGINRRANDQVVFISGLNVGITVNR